MSDTHAANHRLTARVNPRVYRTISEAALLTGATANQFVVQAAFEKASRMLEEERVLTLSEADAKAFFAALDAPPEPIPALTKAFRKRKELVGGA